MCAYLTDQDWNTSKNLRIAAQTWLDDSLRNTNYCDGEIIPEAADRTMWVNLNTGAYWNYKNRNTVGLIATLGRLNNWYTISDCRNIAPLVWHVPTNDEWSALTTC